LPGYPTEPRSRAGHGMRHKALPVHRSSPLLSSYLTGRWREPDSHPRSHPTALLAAHIRPCRIRLHRSRTLVISVLASTLPFRAAGLTADGRARSRAYTHDKRELMRRAIALIREKPADTAGRTHTSPGSATGCAGGSGASSRRRRHVMTNLGRTRAPVTRQSEGYRAGNRAAARHPIGRARCQND